MQALVMVLMVPLMLLNFFGGIGSGIWLAILGEWWAIGYGIAGFLLSHFLLAIILMPGILLVGPAALLMEKGKTFLAFPFLLLSQLYTFAVITAWCMFVFYFFMSRAGQDTFWPLLIWSYGVALGPWMYMAQKEQQGGTGDASAMTTFFAQVAYIVVALVVIFGSATLIGLAMIFGGIMLVGMLIQTGLALAMLREEKRLSVS
jgi:hypothetical protein